MTENLLQFIQCLSSYKMVDSVRVSVTTGCNTFKCEITSTEGYCIEFEVSEKNTRLPEKVYIKFLEKLVENYVFKFSKPCCEGSIPNDMQDTSHTGEIL